MSALFAFLVAVSFGGAPGWQAPVIHHAPVLHAYDSVGGMDGG